MTFLISEDKALREKLQGMVVYDQRSINDDAPRQVAVFFGQPDQEIRNQSYPYVTIDMIGVQRDPSREMRFDASIPDYLQPLNPSSEVEKFVAFELVPVNIDYQITTYARQPRHDREIIAQLLGSKLPLRFGALDVVDDTSTVGTTTTNIVTTRRLDVMDVSKRDTTEQAKRLFMNVITVRVSSELSFGALQNLYQVLEVHIDNPTAQNAGGRNGEPYFIGVGPSIITGN